MRHPLIRALVIALVAVAAFAPQAIAFARGEDSDNGCPPRSTQGIVNASAIAVTITTPVNPPAVSQAWAATNPGEK